jgi:histone H3/H4
MLFLFVMTCLYHQRRFDLIIPPLVFTRLCNEVLHDEFGVRTSFQFSDDAVEALQTATESFVVEKFSSTFHAPHAINQSCVDLIQHRTHFLKNDKKNELSKCL